MIIDEVIGIATISQIAAEANVSSALVSRVLNNKSGVSPENRAKINAIIKKHNYVPNAIARSLVTQKTATIGVVMDSLTERYLFDVISGIQSTAEDYGYNVVFCGGSNDAKIKLKYIDYFSRGRVDGVIAHGCRSQELFIEIIEKASHYVIIEGDIPGKIFNKVLVNNFEGAYRATSHLIGLGCRNIVHFTGDMEYNVSADRLNGFLRAMNDNSLPVDNAIIDCDFRETTAYNIMKGLISEGRIPEAGFAAADKSVYGILRALSEHGLSAPGDIALIGFDGDVPDSRDMVFPKLTTMSQPLFEMGKEAVRLLVRSIEDPDALPVATVFNTELIAGETC